jgi:hypothetical protein
VTFTDEHRRPRVRVLGLLGIVGGIALLAAFVVSLSTALNTVRIFLFLASGVGVALAAHEPQARVSRWLALAGVIPLVLANVVVAIWELLSLGRDRPFAGDFGLVGFWAGLSMWLAHAWYGIATMRIGVLSRWAAIALAGGSVLAITGMDRLELTSSANPTIFGPLSLLGIALNGIAWVLLGLEIVMPGFLRHRLGAAALRP